MSAEHTAAEHKADKAISIEDVVQYLVGDREQRPSPPEAVAALLTAEKRARKRKPRYDYDQLVGTWQLRVVSGTKKPGNGRYVPSWIKVAITYGPQADLLTLEMCVDTGPDQDASSATPLGGVSNRVALGAIALQLSGPTRYWPSTNILSFDFVHLQAQLGRLSLYSAPVRGGLERAQAFAQKALKTDLKDQAFFTFFAIESGYIAARGKGGGLALWTRVNL